MWHNKAGFGRRALYNMKRRYGAPIDLYHVTGTTDDLETGQSTVTRVKYHIRKAILLPITATGEINIVGGYLRRVSNLPSTETVIESRLFIIDLEDLPADLQLNDNDYFIMKTYVRRKAGPGRRFNITKVQYLEDNISLLITGRFIEGGQRNEIFDANVTETLELGESGEGTL